MFHHKSCASLLQQMLKDFLGQVILKSGFHRCCRHGLRIMHVMHFNWNNDNSLAKPKYLNKLKDDNSNEIYDFML